MCLFAYLTSFSILLLQATIFPQIPCFSWILFLATLCLEKSLPHAIWFSAIGVLPLDLLSSDPLGVHALSCMLTVGLGYRLRNLFSSESWIQFSLFSGILSFLQLPALALLLFLFDRRVPFLGKWWFLDWPSLAIIDAAYATLWFVGPLAVYRYLYKIWSHYWLKRQNSTT